MNINLVSEIVESNGKTIRQNNMELQHNIPLGALVEVNYEYGDMNGVRLFVVNHSRDCDGTPLYDLSFDVNAQKDYDQHEAEKDELRQSGLYPFLHGIDCGRIKRHYGEECLKVVN